MVLREMATLWAAANIPRADVQLNFIQRLEQAIQRQVTCSFTIGRKLTKSRKPFLVYGFRGELFVFELSPEQASGLGLKENDMRCADSARPAAWSQPVGPIVRLEAVSVESSSELDRDARIVGSLRYRTDKTLLDPLAVHIVCDPPRRRCTTFYHHLSILTQPEGDIEFTVGKLGDLVDAESQKFSGITPLFFQIWTANELQSPAAAIPAFLTPPPVNAQSTRFDTRNRLPPTARLALPQPAQVQSPPPDHPISDIRALLVNVV